MNSGLVGSFRVQCSALRWPFLQGTCLLLSWKCMHTEIHLGAWKKMSPGNKARILHFLGHWYLRGYASKMDECRALLCVLSHTGRQRWWEETLQAAGGHQLAWGEEEVRDVRTLCSYSTFLDELGFWSYTGEMRTGELGPPIHYIIHQYVMLHFYLHCFCSHVWCVFLSGVHCSRDQEEAYWTVWSKHSGVRIHSQCWR